MLLLKRKMQNLYTIINKICYRVRANRNSPAVFEHNIRVFQAPVSWPRVFASFPGPGVFHRWLWGHWHRTCQAPLCRRPASAPAGGEMSSTHCRWRAYVALLHSTTPWFVRMVTHVHNTARPVLHASQTIPRAPLLPSWLFVSCRPVLVNICGCIPARSAELSTGNLLNFNHADEYLGIIKQ